MWVAYNLASSITEEEWQLTEVKELPKLKGKTYVGIKYGITGVNVALTVACKTEEGKVFISAYDMRNIREGNGWIIKYLSSIKSLDKVVVDGRGNDEILTQELKKAKFKKPVIPGGSDFMLANSQFEQAVFNDGLCHMPQPALDVAVTNCEKRSMAQEEPLFMFRMLKP